MLWDNTRIVLDFSSMAFQEKYSKDCNLSKRLVCLGWSLYTHLSKFTKFFTILVVNTCMTYYELFLWDFSERTVGKESCNTRFTFTILKWHPNEWKNLHMRTLSWQLGPIKIHLGCMQVSINHLRYGIFFFFAVPRQALWIPIAYHNDSMEILFCTGSFLSCFTIANFHLFWANPRVRSTPRALPSLIPIKISWGKGTCIWIVLSQTWVSCI